MSTLLVYPQDDNQLNATEAFLKALKIPFDKVKENEQPYNADFFAKIEKSIHQANEGKVVKIKIDEN